NNLTNSQTNNLTNSPPYKVKISNKLLQKVCYLPLHSSENRGLKACCWAHFLVLLVSFLSRFGGSYLHFAPFCLSSLVANS
ncbi:MAG: hypothetical protein ACFNVK_07300, partial [Prevotella sp.]